MILFLFGGIAGDISLINKQIALAQKAIADGNYTEALKAYQNLYHQQKYQTPEVIINYAHCYYESANLDSAFYYYQQLQQSNHQAIKSIAQQQMGNIELQKGNMKEALEFYKNALRTDPNNEQARYNYEYLKKQQEQQKDKQKNQDKDKQDKKEESQESEKDKQQKNESQKDSKQEDQQSKPKNENQDKKEDKKSKAERFEQIQISPEQAKIIMDALKNNELKYFQSIKKKPLTKPDKTKPDW